ncbi:MAG: class I SAM-dependent methyltransferase [Clostridiales bacterium]|nr:class I SAM-dependent methyltransferase [Clostridiales bacterium]
MKVLVYGLGREFSLLREVIESSYEVIAYSDIRKINIEGYIAPTQIPNIDFDAIFVTSERFYNEIKAYLEKILGDRFLCLSKKDLIGVCDNVVARDSWVISKLLEIDEGKVLLDAGAGEAKYSKYCSHLKYIAQDFGEYKPQQSVVGLQSEKWVYPKNYIKCDIVDMPLDKASVDVVLCTEVFEHIANPVMALKEFSRIIKVGGQMILTAPFASLVHMAPHYYSSGFSRYWYEKNLNEVGFKIVEIRPYGNYFSWLGQEINRLPSMAERYLDQEMSDDEQKTIYKTLNLLRKLELQENQSDEILCYGYMVVAKKEE